MRWSGVVLLDATTGLASELVSLMPPSYPEARISISSSRTSEDMTGFNGLEQQEQGSKRNAEDISIKDEICFMFWADIATAESRMDKRYCK